MKTQEQVQDFLKNKNFETVSELQNYINNSYKISRFQYNLLKGSDSYHKANYLFNDLWKKEDFNPKTKFKIIIKDDFIETYVGYSEKTVGELVDFIADNLYNGKSFAIKDELGYTFMLLTNYRAERAAFKFEEI